MPFSIEWGVDGRTVLCSGSGVVTGQEIVRAKETCLIRPERMRALLQATILMAGITELAVSVDEVKKIASLDLRLAELNHHAAVAIVAPQDIVFGFARMWEVFVEATGWQTGVFRTLLEAEAWLATRGPSQA